MSQAHLTEKDKDRLAEMVHQAVDDWRSGDPSLWRGGDPEGAIGRRFQGLSDPETEYAQSLLAQIIAQDDEQGPDQVLGRIDATGDGGSVPRRRPAGGDHE
jgi:hypothetical protein